MEPRRRRARSFSTPRGGSEACPTGNADYHWKNRRSSSSTTSKREREGCVTNRDNLEKTYLFRPFQFANTSQQQYQWFPTRDLRDPVRLVNTTTLNPPTYPGNYFLGNPPHSYSYILAGAVNVDVDVATEFRDPYGRETELMLKLPGIAFRCDTGRQLPFVVS